MNAPISNPADCEVRGVIRFLQAENVRPSEIQIVTVDETWISHNTRTSTQQSMEWRHSQSPKKPRKFKQTASVRKLMATVFWDRQGVFLKKPRKFKQTASVRKLMATVFWDRQGVLLKKPRKFKQSASARKLMTTVFWDRQGVLLVEFMPRNTTINAETFCATLRRLRKA